MTKKIGIVATRSTPAQKHKSSLQKLYNFCEVDAKNIDIAKKQVRK